MSDKKDSKKKKEGQAKGKKPSMLKAIGIMLLSSALILFIISMSMGLYTRHDKNIPIPALQGKPLSEAIEILESSGLEYEIVDSIYSKTDRPGTIFDLSPTPGHKVKPGRIIFLTVYTDQPRKKPIPNTEGMGERLIESLLRSLGFESIEKKYVSEGSYIGECQGITLASGQRLKVGDMVPITTPIIILIKGTAVDSLSTSDLMSPEGGYGYDSTQSEPATPTKDPEQWW